MSKAYGKNNQERLRAYRQEYARLKARVREVGFICEGSLVERWMPCGKPNCRCATGTELHGPYYQLSWKEKGKTVSHRLSQEYAKLYQEWIANRRRLESILKQMRAVSRKARHYLLAAATEGAPTPKVAASRRRSRPRKKR